MGRPLKSKGNMCIHDRVRLSVFFCRRLTICTTVFPQVITFCMRLMFNLVRVGKEWAGPVFPHPLKSNVYMCIHDRVRLAVFFHRRFTICHQYSPTRYPSEQGCCLTLSGWGKNGPAPKKQRLHVYSWQGKVVCVFLQKINHMHNSFSPSDNLLHEVDV